MNTEISTLFEPFSCGAMEVKNRIVMAPMVTNYSDDGGMVTERLIRHYTERAKGGTGLIIVEATCVDFPVGRGFKNGLRIDDESCVSGLSKLVEAVKTNNTKIGIQLHHAGSQASFSVTGTQPVAPSYMAPKESKPEEQIPRELTEEETKQLVEKFANGAKLAEKAGFDCVQLHGAHFYLIAQFLLPIMNMRTDSYGGSFENRTKFLTDIAKAVRESVGRNFPVICRLDAEQLSPEGDLNETPAVANLAGKAGVDIIDISGCGKIYATKPKTKPDEDLEHFTDDVKSTVDMPVMFGGANEYTDAARLIAAKRIDLAAFGRSLLVDPELPNKIKSGDYDKISPCVDCRACLGCILGKGIPLKCAEWREDG